MSRDDLTMRKQKDKADQMLANECVNEKVAKMIVKSLYLRQDAKLQFQNIHSSKRLAIAPPKTRVKKQYDK